MTQIDEFYERYMPALAEAYQPPRFTHGDCHASQFFLYQADEEWRVSGVVDMEVSSGGDCGADLVKFCLEMAGTFPAATRWWDAFFEGYGGAPSLDLLKLRFLAAHHINFVCYGDQSWPGTREEIVRHILKAENWETLFDMTQIRAAR
jgi:aminoglycoside phosphotransferase (APT) family kinase protein